MSSQHAAQVTPARVKASASSRDFTQLRKPTPSKVTGISKSTTKSPLVTKNLPKQLPAVQNHRPAGNAKATSFKSRESVRDVKPPQPDEEMIKSTGTDSSGVFSEPEKAHPAVARSTIPRLTPSRQHSDQGRTKPLTPRSANSQTQKAARVPTKEVSRHSSLAEQYLRAEFKNETAALKAKHREDLQQLRRELEDKHQNDVALLLAEKEAYFKKQFEDRDQQHRQELLELLEQQQKDKEQWKLEADLQVKQLELHWKEQCDKLLHQVTDLANEKETLQRSINEEVEARVQATVQRLADREKEILSLQAVLELRTEEVRTLRKDVEKLTELSGECATLRERNQTLLNRLEGLEAQLEHKTNEERRLQGELSALSAQCREEVQRSRRLSMEKEQLQWRLSLTFDKYSSLDQSLGSRSLSSADVALGTPKTSRRPPLLKLSPISSGSPHNSIPSPNSTTNNNNNYNSNNSSSSSDNSCSKSCRKDYPAASSTPRTLPHDSHDPQCPESPTVRNFMEKSASVAYVLELGETSPNPPSPASPWQRRRGLFRFSSLRWTSKSKDTRKFK